MGSIEQRRFPRRRTRSVVRVDCEGVSLEVLVVDISASGLGLLLRPGDTLSDIFSVEMRPNQWRRAEVVWRGYPRCGAIFKDRSSATELAGPAPG